MLDAVKAAAIQMDVAWLDPEANVARIGALLDGLAQRGEKVDLAVFPERANLGSAPTRDHPDFRNLSVQYVRGATRVPGPFTDAFGELARKHNMYIVCGLTELHPTVACALYNSSVLIGPSGGILGLHRKVQVTPGERQAFCAGNTINVCPTELGKLSIMVCADITFPELPRVAALKGAEIICASHANTRAWLVRDLQVFPRMVSARAFENNIFLVASNRVGRDGDQVFTGQSCICSPWGDFLAISEVNNQEVVTATLYRQELEAARAHYVYFSYRRPDLYGPLCEPL